MNAYWAAQIQAIWSGQAPTWEAELIDDAEPGLLLVSEDDGNIWRRIRPWDAIGCTAIALQAGRPGETIRMTSQGEPNGA